MPAEVDEMTDGASFVVTHPDGTISTPESKPINRSITLDLVIVGVVVLLIHLLLKKLYSGQKVALEFHWK